MAGDSVAAGCRQEKVFRVSFSGNNGFFSICWPLSVQNPLAFSAWMSGFLSGDVSSLRQRLIGSRPDTVCFSLRRWSACV
ncbi:hypothetical protein ISN44_As08g019220 [Arabidopsis suecica]|uniref:Uncharacterized protein n=1 Tax=Arabidopsis suecica TaxID=45249 RepID=A0A8T2B6E2_ARASU|nr:hypothetical protein ISN44_As08g019220 [Arabidopsis suecica]